MALQNADERTHAQVIEAVRPAFDRYVHSDEVRFTAACWMVTARDDANARQARRDTTAADSLTPAGGPAAGS
jgi:hypothetical protein